jgi:hypothetical protein
MKLRRSLYARPEIIGGQQCAEARPGRRSGRAAAWWCEGTTWVGVSACGRSAWRPRRSGCRLCCRVRVRVRVRHPVSSVRCERPVSDGCLSSDRCPVRASERPDGQCPASGVCALRRPRCPTAMRFYGVWRWGRQPHGWDGRGRRGRPRCPWRRVVCPRLEPGARSWRRPCWASGGRLGLGRRRGRSLALGPVDRVADRKRLGCARGSPIGRQLAVTTLRGHRVRPGPGPGSGGL